MSSGETLIQDGDAIHDGDVDVSLQSPQLTGSPQPYRMHEETDTPSNELEVDDPGSPVESPLDLQRARLDSDWLDQRTAGLASMRDAMLEENKRLRKELNDLDALSRSQIPETFKASSSGRDERGFMQVLRDNYEKEINELQSALDGRADQASTPALPLKPNNSSQSDVSTLYTIINYLDDTVSEERKGVEDLRDQLKDIVQQELDARQAFSIAQEGQHRWTQFQRGVSLVPGSSQKVETDVDELEVDPLEGETATELDKVMLDIKGFIDVSMRSWRDERELPDASTYLNPLYPAFTLPYIPRKIYGTKRGRPAQPVITKDMPAELKWIINRRSRGPVESETLTKPTALAKGKRRADHNEPEPERTTKRRGRPTVDEARAKNPTMFDTITASAEIQAQLLEGRTPETAEQLAGGSFLADDIVYPTPAPNVPTWDPADLYFHTQVPYQIQMARQEMAARLARSVFTENTAPGDDAEASGSHDPTSDLPLHSDMLNPPTHQTRGSSHSNEYQEQPFPSTSITQHGESSYNAPQQDRATKLGRHEEEANATAYSKMNDPTRRKTTCENCGRTGTSVWRQIAVGSDEQRRQYRVCNACGLHYQKYSVMRPKELWGNVHVAPRKRRHAKPRQKPQEAGIPVTQTSTYDSLEQTSNDRMDWESIS